MADDLQPLLDFIGYGNPAGDFWFIGIEEAGSNDPVCNRREHEVKLTFREVEDLPSAEQRLVAVCDGTFDMTKLNPTWAIMSRIVLRLAQANWQDTEAVRDYQATKLGRSGGETFLPEMLPLRKGSDGTWPRDWWPFDRWNDWTEYADAVLPSRLSRLGSLFETHQPKYVFWYGKWYTSTYRNLLFPDATWEPIAGGKIEFSQIGRSTVVLTPFFGYRMFPLALIDEVASRLMSQ